MTSAPLTSPARRPVIQSRALRRFLSHRLALIGVIMVLSLTLACFIGPHLLPYDELHIDLRARFAPPAPEAIFLAPIRWAATLPRGCFTRARSPWPWGLR